VSKGELVGFVAKAEREDVNVSPVRPLREAALLVVGVLGVSVVLFAALAVVVEIAAPQVPPALETRTLGWWGQLTESTMDEEERARADAVTPILDRLLSHWADQPYPIQIAVETSPDVNAYALPGGTILITTGLLDSIRDEGELAFVIGHELGHFARRDQMRGLGRAAALASIDVLTASIGIGRPALTLVNHLDLTASRRFDRRQEAAADAFSVHLLRACYGRGDGAIDFLTTLQDQDDANPGGGLGYLNTHPATADRLEAIRLLLEKGK